MKIELSKQLVEACMKLRELPLNSLGAINLAGFIGERVTDLVGAQIAKHAELVAKRDKLLADHRAGNVDITVAGFELGALDEEIKAIERAMK